MKEVKKPWGYEEVFTFNEISTVKILNVKSNSILSLQKHKKRKEMWYFLTDGWIQLGNKRKKIKKGKIINIEKGQVHRLFSKNKPVQVMEISFGKFDWGDIVRLEDNYGRKGETKI
jgi:mannose-6-phosphate isomerase-like protein (cupin superfamily)